ncbi:hypothetical protein AB6A40_000621 [Gnathostoma spinigerum]|uniref:Uncharacterized protein n=1 Tax=Gnathostoma spinigerum TaxID=75299 RepID=A0ABD6EBQ0_9BILA
MFEITEEARQLGMRHLNYSERGFNSNFWEVFKVHMLDEIKKSYKETAEGGRCHSVQLWNRFIEEIVEAMREGYETKRKNDEK